ncbi:MAG: polysaccharide biosynthesis protein [Lachnospiraceae bacterium]|nr:polysaccharide biosynthesis protein [Lachnospiraceae bacterium]
MKICFTASSGGHLEEIKCLFPVAEGCDSFLITEKSGDVKTVCTDNTYYLRQTNRREPLFFIHCLRILRQVSKILKKEKPDYVISTGALITYLVCIVAKMRKIKIIYIETFARVDRPSLTGRFMYPIADLFLVQWEELKKVFPDAVYVGGVF